MEENVWSSVAGDVYVLVWTIWCNWQAFDFISCPSFLWNNKVKRSFSCRSPARKEFKRLYCHLLQCLFIYFIQNSDLMLNVPSWLLVIFFSDLNSCEFFYETNTATWCKDGYLCLYLSSEFSEFCSTCSSPFVFRKPANKNAFIAQNEHGNNLCWRCFACTLMGK